MSGAQKGLAEARERCLDALEAAQLAVALYDVDVSLLLNLAHQCDAISKAQYDHVSETAHNPRYVAWKKENCDASSRR